MKVIVSHDIDHITASEHYFKDLIVPKHLVRSKLEFLSGKIGFSELTNRYVELFSNKFNNSIELASFNKEHGLSSSFFIGVKNGLGLSYSLERAVALVAELLKLECKLFVHGIDFETTDKIVCEKNIFESAFNINAIGIRMHYVRKNENTLEKFEQAGHLFDSTMHEYKNPYKVGKMWEFPFQIMDGWIIENGQRRQSRNLDESKEATKLIIEKAHDFNLTYLGIDFHDRYFSNSFNTWMNWYMWLIEYLKQNNMEFVSFEEAMVAEEQLLETQTPKSTLT